MRRSPPRAVADRQPDYMERFDATTLFYDVFDDGEGCIVLSGPPLLNLHDEISLSFAVDGVSAFAELKDADRTQRSRVFARGESLVIRGTVDTEVTVGLEQGLGPAAVLGAAFAGALLQDRMHGVPEIAGDDGVVFTGI